MLKLWGRISSLNVRKVALTLQWLEQPFTRIDAGRQFGIVDTAAYREKNFNALVPVLEDGDLVLWESNVIVRYACAKHALGTLYPQRLAARFDAERWMDWQQTTLNPAGRDAFVQLIRTEPAQRDETLITRSVGLMQPLLDQLDLHLAARSFIAGDTFTMADIPLVCEVHRWLELPIPHAPRRYLERWYKHILAQPAIRGVLDVPLS